LTTKGEQPDREDVTVKLAESWPKENSWQHKKKSIARIRQWFFTITVIGLDVSVNLGYELAKINGVPKLNQLLHWFFQE
jgi:hypothetical protein